MVDVSALEAFTIVADRAAGASRILLGIAGPPGAGKSTIAAALVAALGRSGIPSAILPMDGFHLSNAQLTRLGIQGRKGAPETFDLSGFCALLARARAQTDATVFVPDYDRTLHEPVAARLAILPSTRVVVVEGNYLLHTEDGWDAVANHLDITWYIDAPDSIRTARLLQRKDGGRSAAEAERWVADVDRPNAELIARGRSRADFVSSGLLDLEFGR